VRVPSELHSPKKWPISHTSSGRASLKHNPCAGERALHASVRYESYDAAGQRQCEMLVETLESEGWHVRKAVQMIWERLPRCSAA
jgi:hypothetical protein